MTKTITIVSVGLLMSLCAPLPASAGDFDGKKTMLCAPGDARECTADGKCTHVSVDSINIARFITVDAKKKTLSGVNADGETRTTKVKNVEMGGGKTVLQGSENNRSWGIVIDAETGRMSATVIDDQVGFVIFGACTIP